MLDDEVVSAPRLLQNAILTGDSQITGDFSIQDGKDLANILQIGKLPAKQKSFRNHWLVHLWVQKISVNH